MLALMRCSRRIADLSPSTATTASAPAPAIIEDTTEKRTSFRRTAAREATIPKCVVNSRQCGIEAIPEDNWGSAKRPLPSSENTSFSMERGTSLARDLDASNRQIARELAPHTATPAAATQDVQDSQTRSTATPGGEKPAATISCFSTFANIFRAGENTKASHTGGNNTKDPAQGDRSKVDI